MSGFRASSSGVTARFAKPEAIVIRDLVAQVVELVTGGEADAVEAGAFGPGAPEPNAADSAGQLDGAGRSGTTPDDSQEVPDAAALEAMVGFGDAAEQPDDPVLARLLPDAYRDDQDAAREFRRFTESGLRSAKVESAQTLLATLPAGGGRIRLSAGEAEAWLRSLNDVRLALGVRLGVTDDFDALNDGVRPDDPRYPYVQIYQWLAYLQGSLVAALA